MQTGLRQTIISLPAGSEVCFFSDGLVEARTQDGLLGRERLAGLLATLDPAPRGTDLLDRVQACSQSTPDDMAACLLAPEIGADRPCTWVEELEVGASAASDPRVRRFLAACEVPSLRPSGRWGVRARSHLHMGRPCCVWSGPSPASRSRCARAPFPCSQPRRCRLEPSRWQEERGGWRELSDGERDPAAARDRAERRRAAVAGGHLCRLLANSSSCSRA